MSMSLGQQCCYNQVQRWNRKNGKHCENEKEENFQGQEYDPVGPVDEMTELHRLSSLATLGVQTDEHSMHFTYLQPLQSDQPAHHPLSSISFQGHLHETLICNSKCTIGQHW